MVNSFVVGVPAASSSVERGQTEREGRFVALALANGQQRPRAWFGVGGRESPPPSGQSGRHHNGEEEDCVLCVFALLLLLWDRRFYDGDVPRGKCVVCGGLCA